jgi:hypothetical protein
MIDSNYTANNTNITNNNTEIINNLICYYCNRDLLQVGFSTLLDDTKQSQMNTCSKPVRAVECERDNNYCLTMQLTSKKYVRDCVSETDCQKLQEISYLKQYLNGNDGKPTMIPFLNFKCCKADLCNYNNDNKLKANFILQFSTFIFIILLIN